MAIRREDIDTANLFHRKARVEPTALQHDVEQLITRIHKHILEVRAASPENPTEVTVLEDAAQTLASLQQQVTTLAHMADTDPLLGIANRRSFMRDLDRAISLTARHDITHCLIYLDVNGLKTTNDAHGHRTGDALLVHLTRLVSGSIRKADSFARIGGDEFCVLLSHTGERGAKTKIDYLTAILENMPLQQDGQFIPLRVATGITLLKADDTAEVAIDRADRAMYANKRPVG